MVAATDKSAPDASAAAAAIDGGGGDAAASAAVAASLGGRLGKARASCPAFQLQQILGSESDDDFHIDEREPPSRRSCVNWFKDHIEIVGHPRPERPQIEESCVSDVAREEAMRQVALMADRYRAELDQNKAITFQRKGKARSSPDLQNEDRASHSPVAGKREQPSLAMIYEGDEQSPTPACPRLSRFCGSARLLEDAWRRLRRLRRDSEDGCDGRLYRSPGSSLIIFDWDDTLLPTSFILQTVIPSLPPGHREGMLPKSSPYYEELASHAHLVSFVLRAARRVAGVAIVTNSLSPWVVAGGSRFMPGIDVEAILNELGIPIFYARRHADSITASLEFQEETLDIELDHSRGERIGLDILPPAKDGSLRIARIDEFGLVHKWNMANPLKQVIPGDLIVIVNGVTQNLALECRKPQVLHVTIKRQVANKDPFVEAKRIDMETCVKRFCGGLRPNVISVGDSEAEQVALKEVLPRTGRPSSDPLCKTVNLLLHPTVQQLSNELRILAVWLSYMVKYDKDFDIAMDNLNSLERKLFEA